MLTGGYGINKNENVSVCVDMVDQGLVPDKVELTVVPECSPLRVDDDVLQQAQAYFLSCRSRLRLTGADPRELLSYYFVQQKSKPSAMANLDFRSGCSDQIRSK